MTLDHLVGSALTRADAVLRGVAQDLHPDTFEPLPGHVARLFVAGPYRPRTAEYTTLCSVVGPGAAYVANLLPTGEPHIHVWQVELSQYPFDRLRQDEAWDSLASSVLASYRGDWVVVVSQDGFGIISGPASVSLPFCAALPAEAGRLSRVIEQQKLRDASTGELDPLVVRLYGTDPSLE